MCFSQTVKTVGVFVTFCIGFAVIANAGEDLARGWNDKIKWVTLEEALSLSAANNRPIMLLIHKSWCGACKVLQPKFAASEEIEKLSKDFMMVNTLDDEEPSDPKYAPDGEYIPRVLFIDQRGNVLLDIYNRDGSDEYKFFYPEPQYIASSMRHCLEVTKDTVADAGEL